MRSLAPNPWLLASESPPIPEAAAWAQTYDGSRGPLINLAQAVPDEPPPKIFLERLAEAARTPAPASYGPILGDDVLRGALAAEIARLYRADCTAADIAITAGCNQAFFVSMMALARAGDEVILPAPWYFNHKMTLDMLGIRAVPLACRAEDGFVPSPDQARRAINAATRAIVLVTPNNPTGAVYPPKIIEAFAGLCQEAGIALVLDETYRDFLPSDSNAPHACFRAPGWRDTIVQLYSFSKSYAVPGYRLGAMMASPGLLGEVAKVMDCVQICPPRVAQPVVAWAVDALAEWRAETRARINARSALFAETLARVPGWSISAIGAYFAFVRYGSDHPDREMAERLARRCGVVTLPGSFFGAPPAPAGHLRFAVANVDDAGIRALADRLRDA